MRGNDLNKLLDQLGKQHEQSIRSLGAFHRAGAGTKTADTHYRRYERAAEGFDKTLAELRTKLTQSG